jgi:hypothetical protein
MFGQSVHGGPGAGTGGVGVGGFTEPDTQFVAPLACAVLSAKMLQFDSPKNVHALHFAFVEQCPQHSAELLASSVFPILAFLSLMQPFQMCVVSLQLNADGDVTSLRHGKHVMPLPQSRGSGGTNCPSVKDEIRAARAAWSIGSIKKKRF